jgi:hypothetical protein
MSEKLHDWQKEFKLKGNLVQLDVERLESILYMFPRRTLIYTGAGATLKAAIEAEWIESPACEVGDFEGDKRFFYNEQNVDEMNPGAVKWLGNQIDDAYKEATQIPKNL